MPDIDRHDPNTFCWIDLSTTDVDDAVSFYTGLFGWEAVEQEVPGSRYVQFNVRGRAAAAAGAQMEAESSMGIPPHWNNYIATDSADESFRRIVEAGGTVMAEPFDVLGVGRMLVAADPTGAVFSMWEAKSHIGAQVVGDSGAMCWNELMTPDTEKAGDFYTSVFGWQTEAVDMGNETTYTLLKRQGAENSVAGMMPPPPGVDMPPNWTAYIAVDNCQAAVDRCKELGGNVYFGPQDVPNVGIFATLADRQGAAFAILEPDPEAQQAG